MSSAVSKFVAVLLAVALLFVYPAAEAYQKQDDLSRLVVYNAVTQFVDAVRNKGYLTPVMYQDFLQEIEATGNAFDVQMEHLHKKYTPVYADAANPDTFQNDVDVSYEGFYTADILSVIYPDNTLPKDHEARKYRMNVGDFFKVTVKTSIVRQGRSCWILFPDPYPGLLPCSHFLTEAWCSMKITDFSIVFVLIFVPAFLMSGYSVKDQQNVQFLETKYAAALRTAVQDGPAC